MLAICKNVWYNWNVLKTSRTRALKRYYFKGGAAQMAKCDICGKGVTFGIKVSHSHRRSNRTWKPNVKRVKAIVDGTPKHIYVCTRCLRSGKVTRAVWFSTGNRRTFYNRIVRTIRKTLRRLFYLQKINKYSEKMCYIKGIRKQRKGLTLWAYTV